MGAAWCSDASQASVPGARSGTPIDLVSPRGCCSDIDPCSVMMPQACIGSGLPDLSGLLSFDGESNLQTLNTTWLAVSRRGACCKSEAESVASR